MHRREEHAFPDLELPSGLQPPQVHANYLCISAPRTLNLLVEACILSCRGIHSLVEQLAFPRTPFHLKKFPAYTEPVSLGN